MEGEYGTLRTRCRFGNDSSPTRCFSHLQQHFFLCVPPPITPFILHLFLPPLHSLQPPVPRTSSSLALDPKASIRLIYTNVEPLRRVPKEGLTKISVRTGAMWDDNLAAHMRRRYGRAIQNWCTMQPGVWQGGFLNDVYSGLHQQNIVFIQQLERQLLDHNRLAPHPHCFLLCETRELKREEKRDAARNHPAWHAIRVHPPSQPRQHGNYDTERDPKLAQNVL